MKVLNVLNSLQLTLDICCHGVVIKKQADQILKSLNFVLLIQFESAILTKPPQNVLSIRIFVYVGRCISPIERKLSVGVFNT